MFGCEYMGAKLCHKRATVEVRGVDEDGDTYSGYYCDDHTPEIDPVWQEIVELRGDDRDE